MKTLITLIGLSLSICGYAQTKLIDSLMQVVSHHSGDTLEVLTLDRLANEFMRSDPAKAKHYVRQELELSKRMGYSNGMSNAYARLVTIYQRTGNLDSAEYFLAQYEILKKNNPTNTRIATNYANTTGLFYKTQGRSKEALPYLLDVLSLIPVDNKTGRAGQLLNIGNVYNDLGDFNNAVSYHLKSLALFEELKNTRGQSFALQSLGSDFLLLKQYTQAEKYLLQSEKIKQELGDKRGLLSSWTSLGEVYRNLNRPEVARTYLNKAIEKAREFNSTPDLKNLLFNMAQLLKEENKVQEARNYLNEALTIGEQSGDTVYTTKVKAELILLDKDVQKTKHNEQLLTENISVSYEKGDHINAAEGYDKLADWYAEHKQFEKAYTNLKLAHALNDSLRGQEVIVHLNRLEEEFQSEKKEKEIALLKKDQELQALTLSRQRLIITSIIIVFLAVMGIGVLLINRYRLVNKTKRELEIEQVRNHIARDLHDDIGSTLSSINILSQVALTKNDNAQGYFQRISDQSSRMMENISDIVWSINPKNDSMEQVIVRMREFSSEIFESRNMGYAFTENVKTDLKLDAAQRKNIFLIFKEAVNNAAKYSEATKVTMTLHQNDRVLMVCIHDNGKGFDEHVVKSGNGLRNLRERALEIGGSIVLESKIGTGTKVEFHMKVA